MQAIGRFTEPGSFMKARRTRIFVWLLIFSIALQVHADAQAQDFFSFSDTSISALTGWGYELPGNHLSTFTLENANSWIGGDFYGFVDLRYQPDNPGNKRSWYGEFSPRFSLAKMAHIDFGDHLVKDVLIATTWERGKGGNKSFLVGAGVTLDIPGFRFFTANLYVRSDKSQGAEFDDMQFTFAWDYPFTIGKYRFVSNGFSDYIFGWGPRARNFHLSQQLNFDVGARSGKPGKYFLGLEFDYWNNQFGIKNSPELDTRQRGISILFRVHL